MIPRNDRIAVLIATLHAAAKEADDLTPPIDVDALNVLSVATLMLCSVRDMLARELCKPTDNPSALLVYHGDDSEPCYECTEQRIRRDLGDSE